MDSHDELILDLMNQLNTKQGGDPNISISITPTSVWPCICINLAQRKPIYCHALSALDLRNKLTAVLEQWVEQFDIETQDAVIEHLREKITHDHHT
jgi:hypothetical protein